MTAIWVSLNWFFTWSNNSPPSQYSVINIYEFLVLKLSIIRTISGWSKVFNISISSLICPSLNKFALDFFICFNATFSSVYLFLAKYTFPNEPEPNLLKTSYFLDGESFISSMNNLLDIVIDDSPSDKNELPTDDPPKEFFLSWIEFIDCRSSSSNSDFLFELNLIESKVDFLPSFLLNFSLFAFSLEVLDVSNYLIEKKL